MPPIACRGTIAVERIPVTRSRQVTRFLLPALAGLLCAAGTARAQDPAKSLGYYVQNGFRDISTTVAVISKNDRELDKIGAGYVDAYSLSRQTIQAKEPDRFRLEGRKGVFTIRYITSGSRKATQAPSLGIKKVADISKDPARGDNVSDIGLVSQSWADRVQNRWLRTEQRDGKTLQVFQFWYREDPKYRHTIWLDPSTRTMVEHVYHHRGRRQQGFKKRVVYSEPKQINGIWVPTRMTLFNGDNKQAGVIRYDAIKVNSGLPDSLFAF